MSRAGTNAMGMHVMKNTALTWLMDMVKSNEDTNEKKIRENENKEMKQEEKNEKQSFESMTQDRGMEKNQMNQKNLKNQHENILDVDPNVFHVTDLINLMFDSEEKLVTDENESIESHTCSDSQIVTQNEITEKNHLEVKKCQKRNQHTYVNVELNNIDDAVDDLNLFESEFDPLIHRSLDMQIELCKAEIRRLKFGVSKSMRAWSLTRDTTASKIKKCEADVNELVNIIGIIRSEAELSEKMVDDICKDIKMLDTAKINLLSTIKIFKRVTMYAAASEQLENMVETSQFKNCAKLISVLDSLYVELGKEDIMIIKKIKDNVAGLKDKLFLRIFSV